MRCQAVVDGIDKDGETIVVALFNDQDYDLAEIFNSASSMCSDPSVVRVRVDVDLSNRKHGLSFNGQGMQA